MAWSCVDTHTPESESLREVQLPHGAQRRWPAPPLRIAMCGLWVGWLCTERHMTAAHNPIVLPKWCVTLPRTCGFPRSATTINTRETKGSECSESRYLRQSPEFLFDIPGFRSFIPPLREGSLLCYSSNPSQNSKKKKKGATLS